MSQISSIIMGAVPGGGPVLTLTGNTGGAVPPTGGGTINVVGAADSFVQVTGTPGTSTLEISLLNQQIAVVQTLDAVPLVVTALNFPMAVDRAVTLTYEIIAAIDDYSEMFSGVSQVSVLRTGAAAPVIQVGQQSSFSDGFANTPSTAVQINGNTVEFLVIGVAATTINWKVVLNFISI